MDIEQVLEVWWVLPTAALFSTVALASGVSGALFFSPFLILAVGLEPAQAVGAGLITELIGTSFGSISYIRQRVVDFKTVRFLIATAIPLGIVGALLAHRISGDAVTIILGSLLLLLAAVMTYSLLKKKGVATQVKVKTKKDTIIKARDGTVYRYRVCRRWIGMTLAGIGAFFTGLVSAGLPEITTTQLVVRCSISPRIAVATAVVTLTITVFMAAIVHVLSAEPTWYVVAWAVPGAIIGALAGSRLERRIKPRLAEKAIAVIFMVVGILVITVSAG